MGIFGNLMRTKEFRWDIDGNNTNLMGTFWELDGKSNPHPFQKDKKHHLGACLYHPIGSPIQKKRNIGAPHMNILTCFFRHKLLG
jgi:hypothetical protein